MTYEIDSSGRAESIGDNFKALCPTFWVILTKKSVFVKTRDWPADEFCLYFVGLHSFIWRLQRNKQNPLPLYKKKVAQHGGFIVDRAGKEGSFRNQNLYPSEDHARNDALIRQGR